MVITLLLIYLIGVILVAVILSYLDYQYTGKLTLGNIVSNLAVGLFTSWLGILFAVLEIVIPDMHDIIIFEKKEE